MSLLTASPKPRRILTFDIIRGVMIAYVIFLHALIQRVFSSDGSQFALVVDRIPIIAIILLSPLILLSLWGSVFTFISGASTAYSFAQKFGGSSQDLTMHFKKKISGGIALYLIFLIEKFFFSVRIMVHPETTYSLFTGSLEQGKFQWPSLLHLTSSSTLESIALTSILISLFLFFLWKKKGMTKARTIKILILVGIFNLVLTSILRAIMPDPSVSKEYLLNNNLYLVYSLYLRLFADRFAHFPVFAFGLFGAAISLSITEPNGKAKTNKLGLKIAIPSLILFTFHMFNGFDVISGFHEEMVPLPLQYLNIGLQIIVTLILLNVFDFRNRPLSKNTQKFISAIQKYSALSLTVYVLEPFFSQLWYMLFETMYGGPFFMELPKILLYLETCIIFWWILVKLWDQGKYKFSLEWVMKNLQELLERFSQFYLDSIRNTNQYYLSLSGTMKLKSQ